MPDGHTQRDHLNAAWRASGVKPQGLDGPGCPEDLALIWKWYREISHSRARGFGVQAISHAEIEAWARLHARRLSPFELECLAAIDAQYLTVFTDKGKPRGGSRGDQG